MCGCPKDKGNKMSDIPVSNTCSNPWTVMVMHLYAHITVLTMKCSWWSQNLTRFTIWQLVPTMLYNFFSIFTINLWHKRELLQAIVHLSWCCTLLYLLQLILGLIAHIVILIRQRQHLIFLNLCSGKYSWISYSSFEQISNRTNYAEAHKDHTNYSEPGRNTLEEKW